jgi:hypothetical protein
VVPVLRGRRRVEAVHRRPADALAAAGVSHQEHLGQLRGRGLPDHRRGGRATGAGPVRPAGQVCADQRRPGLGAAVLVQVVLAVDAVGRDRHGDVTLRGQQLLGLQVSAVAGDRLGRRRTGPVVGDLLRVGALEAGEVPPVQEQGQRAAAGRALGGDHDGTHLDRRRVARDRQAGQVVLAGQGGVGTLDARIDRCGSQRRDRRRFRRGAALGRRGRVEAAATRAYLQVLDLPRVFEAQREGPVVRRGRPAEQPVPVVELDLRVARRHQIRRRPGQGAFLADLPGRGIGRRRPGRTTESDHQRGRKCRRSQDPPHATVSSRRVQIGRWLSKSAG